MTTSACPYARADSSSVTSDDENATLPGSHPPKSGSSAAEALALAKSSCPAFQGGKACPFRDARDAEGMREAMKNVPASHVGAAAAPSSPGADSVDGKFRLALEHVHRVGMTLQHGDPDGAEGGDGGDDKFLIKGGCPFKTFYQGADGSKPPVPFVEAMEGFSLGSILASAMAKEEEERAEREQKEELAKKKLEDAKRKKKREEEERKKTKDEEEKREAAEKAKKEKEMKEKEEAGNQMLAALAFDFGGLSPSVKPAKMSEIAAESPAAKSSAEPEARVTEESAAEADVAIKEEKDRERKDPDTPKTDEEKPEEEEETPTSLSCALKLGTAESHSAAESVHFVADFVKGKIDRDLFARLTVALLHAYEALEEELDNHGPLSFPSLHHPHELARKESLEDDVEFFFGDNWKGLVECRPTPATADYVNRIRFIARTEPLLLLSHAYTRYLGDLSGGRVLMRVARRALNLGGSDDGLRFYKFENVSSPKKFKDEYRQELDGLDLDAESVERLVAEANVAFVLNMRLFEELDVANGVKGATVRDLKEATRYYDEVVEEQEKRKKEEEGKGERRGSNSHFLHGAGGDAAKCPFAKLATSAADTPATAIASDEDKSRPSATENSPSTISVVPLGQGTMIAETKEKKERCPWPFVFFHDPSTGMKDWQTWAVLGLLLCWVWALVKPALVSADSA